MLLSRAFACPAASLKPQGPMLGPGVMCLILRPPSVSVLHVSNPRAVTSGMRSIATPAERTSRKGQGRKSQAANACKDSQTGQKGILKRQVGGWDKRPVQRPQSGLPGKGREGITETKGRANSLKQSKGVSEKIDRRGINAPFYSGTMQEGGALRHRRCRAATVSRAGRPRQPPGRSGPCGRAGRFSPAPRRARRETAGGRRRRTPPQGR